MLLRHPSSFYAFFKCHNFEDCSLYLLKDPSFAIHRVPHIEQRLILNVGCCSVVMNLLMNGCGKFKGYYLVFVYFVKIRFQRKSKGTVWNSQSLQFHGEHRSLPRGCRGLIISLFIVGC